MASSSFRTGMTTATVGRPASTGRFSVVSLQPRIISDAADYSRQRGFKLLRLLRGTVPILELGKRVTARLQRVRGLHRMRVVTGGSRERKEKKKRKSPRNLATSWASGERR